MLKGTKKVKNPRKWKDRYYVLIYQYARSGCSDGEIARLLKVRRSTFDNWKLSKPALRDALARARGTKGERGSESLHQYVYKNLSPRNKALWDELEAAWKMDNPYQFVEKIMVGKGRRTRQMMWLHALFTSNFNGSEACRKAGVPKTMLDHWIRTDPAFVDMLKEVEWHKQNFFEEGFIKAVERGETAAVVHAAKTQLADRGYGPKGKTVNVNVNGTVNHQHNGLSIKDLLEQLPVKERVILLNGMKSLRAAQNPANQDVQDAEIVQEEDKA